MISTAANALWLAGCLGEAVRFRRALASFIDKLQILSRSTPSNAPSDR